jgi:hypothetical protein
VVNPHDVVAGPERGDFLAHRVDRSGEVPPQHQRRPYGHHVREGAGPDGEVDRLYRGGSYPHAQLARAGLEEGLVGAPQDLGAATATAAQRRQQAKVRAARAAYDEVQPA